MHLWVEKDYVTMKAFGGLGEGRLSGLRVPGSFSTAGLAFHPGEREGSNSLPVFSLRKTYI